MRNACHCNAMHIIIYLDENSSWIVSCFDCWGDSHKMVNTGMSSEGANRWIEMLVQMLRLCQVLV